MEVPGLARVGAAGRKTHTSYELLLPIASADDQRAALEPVLVVRPALDGESPAAGVEPEVDLVGAGREVRLELDLVAIGDEVAHLPERETVAAIQRFVVAVEAPLKSVDVYERFPCARDAADHAVVDDESVAALRHDV